MPSSTSGDTVRHGGDRIGHLLVGPVEDLVEGRIESLGTPQILLVLRLHAHVELDREVVRGDTGDDLLDFGHQRGLGERQELLGRQLDHERRGPWAGHGDLQTCTWQYFALVAQPFELRVRRPPRSARTRRVRA